ncbi:MAG: class I SAM-dependent methyltransferase [Solirubrobacterales bacterium]
MSDRLAREQAFHDARFAEGGEARSADRFYAINAASDRFFRDQIEQLPPNSYLLDYGCGDAAYCAIHGAQSGHRVAAMDISPVAIERAKAKAMRLGFSDRIEFQVMNAEELEFADASFDAVGGLGVLHHLDLEIALASVTRVLKPEGKAFFVEPLGHNPLINLFRRRTPEQRSPDEHPLLMDDLELIRRFFGELDASYFHLLGLLALPASGRSFLDRAVQRLDAADQALFRHVTMSRKHAWMVGLSLAKPRPAAAQLHAEPSPGASAALP